MATDYPWNGRMKLTINPTRKISKAVHIRIPGWLNSNVIPGDLYSFSDTLSNTPNITVNGKAVNFSQANGYAIVEKTWQKGDVIEIDLPMPVRTIASKKDVTQNTERLAIQRGPLVYCIEGTDNNGKAWNILIPRDTKFTQTNYTVSTEPVIALKTDVPVVTVSAGGTNVQTEKKTITAIPYYSWANRGKTEMQVWLPTVITDVKLNY
jgi:DUF1680 family protein